MTRRRWLYCLPLVFIAEIAWASATFQRGSQKISGLSFESDDLAIATSVGSGRVSVKTQLSGIYSKTESGWSLVHENETIASSASKAKSFEIIVELNGPRTELELTAAGPGGELEVENLALVFDDWEELLVETSSVRFSRGLLELGPTYLTFNDSRGSRTTQGAIYGSASFEQLILTHRLEVGAQLEGVLLPIFSSERLQFRQITGSLHGGYYPKVFQMPWKLGFLGGVSIAWMYPSIEGVGFKRISGPEALIKLMRADQFHPISIYAKFTSTAGGLSAVSRELSAGGTYGFRLADDQRFHLRLEASNFKLKVRSVEVTQMSYLASLIFEI
jgi:hypothetical protein